YYKVGDEVILEMGNRVSEGYVLGQYNPYMNASEGEPVEGSEEAPPSAGETLEVLETRTFTVVGFYERPSFENYTAPGYTAITVMDKVRPEGSLYNFYFKLDTPSAAYDWFSGIGVAVGCSSEMNDDVLRCLGVSNLSAFNVILYGLAAIVCGLIMFGSVALIYNAFSISVSERTKQFGLLSSIGATKKQIRKMVIFEAMLVGVIGIPFGILAGIFGMGVTFHFIGNAFNELTNYVIPFTLCIHPGSIVAACVITLSTVLISAWIPSKRATMVTAVEAIRQSNDVKLSRREKKKIGETSWGEKVIYRFFGLPGMIADKYYKRSKRKYRTTIVSLFMSIVLFISASAFTSYLTDSVERGFAGNGYDIMYHYDPTAYMTEEDVLSQDFSEQLSHEELSEILKDADSVTDVAYSSNKVGHVDIDNKYLSESFVKYMHEKNEELGYSDPEGYTNVYVSAVFVEDSVYEAFLEDNKLEKHIFANPEKPLGVAIDGNTFFDYSLGKYVTTNVLKEDEAEVVLGYEEDKATLKIGAIVEDAPFFVNNIYELPIVYPYSLREAVLQELNEETFWCDYYIVSENHRESYKDLKNVLVEQGLSKSYLYDYAEGVEENRTLILIINVFSYGFIALISLIAAANVFNTISTNISLRRREFAMLKSAGMSDKEMNRMMNFECLLYGSRALLYGLPVSMLITWFIYRIISEGFTTGFYLPWGAIGIAIFSVFLVVFATMMYSMEKIKQDNPMDALKNENL
ncbi:MAG: ABC transporter permease, partial [Agathobacter sp.]|nr:ABC transporter permease [Agathobacter sp.]